MPWAPTTGTCEEIADPDVRDACDSSGFEQHGGAFILLGVAALAMAWGAGRGASRPAAIALVAIGAVVLAFSLIRDVPARPASRASASRSHGRASASRASSASTGCRSRW